MIIEKIVKTKNRYHLFCSENNEITVTEDLFYLLNLEVGKDFDTIENWDEKLEEDRVKQCFQSAIQKLNCSMLSEMQLKRKLEKENFDISHIKQALLRLKELNFINDKLLSEELIRSSKKQNLSKIQIELKLLQKGIQESIWKEQLEQETSEEGEIEKACAFCCKKIKKYRNKTKEEIRKKLYYSLNYKGFSYSVSNKAVSKILDETIFEENS
mgnify:FL=1